MNPLFVSYAKSNGLSPSRQLDLDTLKYPGGIMCGFLLWVTERKQAFRRNHPEAFCGFNIADKVAWLQFIDREADQAAQPDSAEA